MSSNAVSSRKLGNWQMLNVALLIIGYSGYYLCRSNLSDKRRSGTMAAN